MQNWSWKKGGVVLVLAVLSLAGWTPEADARPVKGKAKHIIVFIGDGMQLEHEIATSRYLYGKDYDLSFQKLAYKGQVATWDVTTHNKYATALAKPAYSPGGFEPLVGYDPIRGGEKPYPLQTDDFEDAYFLTKINGKIPATDSASAATAIATGYKTDDGNIAWLPGDLPGGALTTIAETLRKEKGFAIGVVSTVPFTHATPAAFVSHNVNRGDYSGIGTEIIQTFQPEVVIGGGYPGPTGTNKYSYLTLDDYNYLKSGPSPYVFVERETLGDGSVRILDAAQEAVKGGKKLFGLFGGPGGNFESPEPSDLPGTPIVQRATLENPLLKDATQAALLVLSQDPDGFLVMIEQGDIDWANHANDYKRMVGTTWDLHEAVQTTVDFVNRPGDDIDWSNTLLIVTSDHSNSYMRLVEDKKLGAGDLPEQTNDFKYPGGEVTYSTGDHTNELVRLYAHGGPPIQTLHKYEGAWYPCTRIIDNTQIYHLMAASAGLRTPSPLKPVVKMTTSCREDD